MNNLLSKKNTNCKKTTPFRAALVDQNDDLFILSQAQINLAS